MKSQLIGDMAVDIDADHNQLFLKGVIHVPVEEMRAINLDPKLGTFRFHVAIQVKTTTQGHLILAFPLHETYLYPEGSNSVDDRVVVPVQMLSVALASARGYLAALSGDFSGFDRQTAKLEALEKSLNRSIKEEKNSDARDAMKTQQEQLKLQLEAVPLERKQLESLSKEFSGMLGFTGEKELNLNDDLAAQKNALILKVKLSQLIPYLTGVELGGVRMRHDTKDGAAQNYLAIDVNAQLLDGIKVPPPDAKASPRKTMAKAPDLVIRLNQSMFESQALSDMEKKDMNPNVRELEMILKDDGLHVTGKWHALLFNVPFDALLEFIQTKPDIFEVRMRDMDVAGIDVEFLQKYVLETTKKRLDKSFKGICDFTYVQNDGSKKQALQVSVDPKKLVPAFDYLHLIDVDVRDSEFLMKIGRL